MCDLRGGKYFFTSTTGTIDSAAWAALPAGEVTVTKGVEDNAGWAWAIGIGGAAVASLTIGIGIKRRRGRRAIPPTTNL